MLLSLLESLWQGKHCFSAAMASALTNHFAVTLFSAILTPDNHNNAVFSPVSISTALALVAAGSKGRTLDEIRKAIGWQADNGDFVKATAEMQRKLQEYKSSCVLKSANGVWLAREFQILKEYELLMKQFNAVVADADFKTNSSEAQAQINAWVSNQTNQKIPELFPSGHLEERTKAVLVNALYFKCDWLQPFDKKMTEVGEFSVSNNKKVNVPMMFHSGEFAYLYDERSKCDLVQLPYSSSSFSMIVIVPHEVEGLKDIILGLNDMQISKWIDDLKRSSSETVDLFLPKFKVTQKIDLKSYLKQIGINEMFTDQADLSGISGMQNLYVSSAFHQALIEVSEEGTEAAAATGVGISFMSLPPQVRADRPFMFMVISKKTNDILFIGRVLDPSI